MPDEFIVPERVTREAYIDLLEQLEALRAENKQLRTWLAGFVVDPVPLTEAEKARLREIVGSNPAISPEVNDVE